jgi:hypothetical protein
MASNRPRSLQVYDPVLTNFARRYKSGGYIADSLLASQPVKTLSAQYPVFTKRFWFAVLADNEVTDRAPANEVDFEWSTESYLCREYALKISITDLERMQALDALKLEKGKTELLTQQMKLAHEIRVAARLRKTTNGGDLNLGATPSVNWDQDTATIEADIKAGVVAVYDACGGLVPNVIVIPWKDATGQGVPYLKLGDRILPAVIHGMRVVIPMGAQVDGAREGNPTDSVSEIWGDHVRLLYVNEKAEWGIPSVAYKFDHTKKKVTRWSTVDPDVDYVREMERYDVKVVAPDAGYELTAVLS